LIREQYGKIYLNFGQPVSLRNYLEEVMKPDLEEEEFGYDELGYDLVSEINRLTLVTPGGLVAAALLSSARPARRDEELFKAWRGFYRWLLKNEVRLAKTFESIRDWQEEALIFYQARKLVEINYDDVIDQRIITLPEEKRLSLEFYKNNIVHFFLAPSMIALLSLKSKPAENLQDEFRRMKKMFRFDFVMSEGKDEEELKASLSYFDSEWEMNEEILKNFAGLIANFLESYIIALRTLISLRTSRTTEQDFLDRAKKVGEQLYKLREIDRPESVSQLNFQNALKWMQSEGWLHPEQDHFSLNTEMLKSAEQEFNWITYILSSIRHF